MESACRRTDPRAIPLDPPRGRQAVETTPAQATLAMGVIGGIVTWSSLRALRSRSVDTGLFLPALAAYAGHAFAHLAESAVAGGYTPGAITSPLVVLPYSVCAWQTLRHAGLADRQRVLRALGSGWPDAAGHPRCVRFGYPGSSMPPEATPAAQADALAALLDALGIGQIDVIGISAGTTSALQLALRHPERVSHLVVISGNLPGG